MDMSVNVGVDVDVDVDMYADDGMLKWMWMVGCGC